MKDFRALCLFIVFIAHSMVSYATEDSTAQKIPTKVALVVVQDTINVKISSTNTHFTGGLLGALIAKEANEEKRTDLTYDLDIYREMMTDYPVREMIHNLMKERLSQARSLNKAEYLYFNDKKDLKIRPKSKNLNLNGEELIRLNIEYFFDPDFNNINIATHGTVFSPKPNKPKKYTKQKFHILYQSPGRAVSYLSADPDVVREKRVKIEAKYEKMIKKQPTHKQHLKREMRKEIAKTGYKRSAPAIRNPPWEADILKNTMAEGLLKVANMIVRVLDEEANSRTENESITLIPMLTSKGSMSVNRQGVIQGKAIHIYTDDKYKAYKSYSPSDFAEYHIYPKKEIMHSHNRLVN